MPASKAVWAIDIGQSALKAIHAKLVGEDVEIDSYVILPHEQILSQPEADEPALIRQTLAKFAAQFPVIKDPVIISVPGHRSFARFSKLPPVEPKKIPDIVHYEATQQIPFGIDEVVWDYHVFQPEGSPEVEVGIFAIKTSIISQYLGYFHELKIHPIMVQTAPVALYNAFFWEGLIGKEAGVIADVGAQNTNFLITEDHRLWLRNIPLGGNNFTEALQKSFKLNFAKAEELKCTAATSKYARAVFQSMRPVFSDLSAEFQRSIGFYTSVNRESHVSQMHALGNAFRLPGLLKFLQQNLGMPVKRLDSLSKVSLTGGINEADFSENVLTLAVAYGLAIQGLGLAKVNTDLMPAEIVRQVAWKQKGYWFMGAAACLVLAAAGVWLKALSVTSVIRADMEQNQQVTEQIIQAGNQNRTDYQTYSNFETLKSKLVTDLEQLSKQRLVLPQLMGLIAKSIPTQKELAEAQSLDEYKKAAGSIPRENRTQLIVNTIQVTYVPNLTDQAIADLEKSGQSSNLRTVSRTSEASPGMGQMGGPMGGMPGGPMGGMPGGFPGGPGGMPGGPGGPGSPEPGASGSGLHRRSESTGPGVAGDGQGAKAFLITIDGTTPHAGAPDFLTATLMKSLQNYGKKYAVKNKMPFWIDHVRLGSCQTLVPPASLNQGEMNRENLSKDPLTDEVIVNDSLFIVTFVVNLGAPPVEPGNSTKGGSLETEQK